MEIFPKIKPLVPRPQQGCHSLFLRRKTDENYDRF